MQYEDLINQCKNIATLGTLTRKDVLRLANAEGYSIKVLDRAAECFQRNLDQFRPKRIHDGNGNSWTIANKTQAHAFAKECAKATAEALEIVVARKQHGLPLGGFGTRNQPELNLI